jgi:protein-tyrosine phosphatase
MFHSFHGVSRSAALVISYLQNKHNISTDEALARLDLVSIKQSLDQAILQSLNK